MPQQLEQASAAINRGLAELTVGAHKTKVFLCSNWSKSNCLKEQMKSQQLEQERHQMKQNDQKTNGCLGWKMKAEQQLSKHKLFGSSDENKRLGFFAEQLKERSR